MESKGKNNTFWKPGMIVSVAMFVLFGALVLAYALMPGIIGSKFTQSERPAIEKWITILAVDGEPVKDIKHVKGGFPFYCYKDKDLKGHRQASLPGGRIYISDYIDKEDGLLLRVYQGKNIKRIIEPREKVKESIVAKVTTASIKATVRYMKNDKAPFEYAVTFNKEGADVMVLAQSPRKLANLESLTGSLSSLVLCD